MENILEVKNLTKQFGSFIAVNDISFSLSDGEILGLLGVNGAGKTTTLQMLLNTLLPTKGEITYFGKNLHEHTSDIMEEVNFSSTYINMPWNLTVQENLTYISYLYAIENRKKRIERIIELFDLKDLQKKQIRELSAGQQTRVNLAKAFINFPKVLLLDEPTASLDVETADMIRRILLTERDMFHTSMLFTSHNMAEVEEICDRVVFIHAGKIIASDSPDNLAKSIQTAHVELLINEEMKKIITYCQKQSLSHEIKGKRIIINVHEKDIAHLLQDLGKHGISYKEISIEKPTLEDFFLQVAAKEAI